MKVVSKVGEEGDMDIHRHFSEDIWPRSDRPIESENVCIFS